MPLSRLRPLLLLTLFATGCATQVIPPAHPHDPQTVYLTDYGRHSSLLLPLPTGGYREYAFGDWEFFARGNTKWWVALRALLDSPQATLGWRDFDSSHSAFVAGGSEGYKRVMSFQADRPRIEALEMNLDATIRRSTEPPFHSSYSSLYHVRDNEHYWLFHNCNHVTAEWLGTLGCQIRGFAMLSHFVVTTRH